MGCKYYAILYSRPECLRVLVPLGVLELIPLGTEGQLHALIQPLLGARDRLGTGGQSGQRLGGQRGPNPAPPFHQQPGSQRGQCPHSIVVSATQAANSDAQSRQRMDLSDTGRRRSGD